MTGWTIRKFSGTAPRLEPRQLPDVLAQSASNCVLTAGSLRPLKANTAVATLPKAGVIQTIYRFGQDTASDTLYWFHWAADVDVARGPIFGDVQERTYFTSTSLAAPQVTDATNALGAGGAYPTASYTLGVPAPTAAPTLLLGGTPTSPTALPETRVYVVTFITAWGEESAPSPASLEINVKPGETVTLTLPSVPTGAFNFAGKRIYRSVPGQLGTPYLFVAETLATAPTYVDSSLAAALGEQLPSLGHSMPPATLQGLVSMPNGVLAGFTGRDVYFSEPYKPHAWPVAYSLTVDHKIIGLGVFGNTLLVLTTGNPVLISGADPTNYVQTKADISQPCVSKRSIAHADNGVVFASPDGLFMVNGGGFRNLTEQLYSRVEWQALLPHTMSGYIVDNKYVGFYNNAAGFILDLITGDHVPLDWYASAGFYDSQRDALFLVTASNALVKFNAGANLTMTWRSKPFYTPSATCMAAARVEAAAYPVTAKVYADNVLKHTQSVTTADAFRLPSGFRANTWSVEVSGTNEVLSLGIAESVAELKNG